ncbi:MAG: NAD(P)H-dependent oxidoreductase [Myxococcota bacterium]
MKLLAFSASLRAHSLNRKLILAATELARARGIEVDLAEFRTFDMPMYDGDVDEATGLPPGALALCRRIEAADAVMIASPEYNYSIPGVLKNAIDWVSMADPTPLKGKLGLLLSASPSVVGGIRGLWQLRIPLEGCGMFVHPEMFTVGAAYEAFDAEGRLLDPKAVQRLDRVVGEFRDVVAAMAGRAPA